MFVLIKNYYVSELSEAKSIADSAIRNSCWKNIRSVTLNCHFVYWREYAYSGHIENKNSSGDDIANVNFFYNIAHVEASAYADWTSS